MMLTNEPADLSAPGVDIDAVHFLPEAPASPAALAILRAMARYPSGSSASDLQQVTGLSLQTVHEALRGLRQRGRAKSMRIDRAVLWFTLHHFKALTK
jgi:DNA-binding transcriptional ArsR family regulator